MVACASGAVGNSFASQAELLTAGCARGHFHFGLTVDRRDGRHGAEDRAIERDTYVRMDVGALDAQPAAVGRFDLALELGVLTVLAKPVEIDALDPHAAATAAARTTALLGEELTEQVSEVEHAGTAALAAVRVDPAWALRAHAIARGTEVTVQLTLSCVSQGVGGASV